MKEPINTTSKKILHLTLKKKWFDMIASGQKTEEYRECNDYWAKRLIGNGCRYKDFDIVRFKNGYAKTSPTIDVECSGIMDDLGNPDWGAELNKIYYVIYLGAIKKQVNTT